VFIDLYKTILYIEWMNKTSAISGARTGVLLVVCSGVLVAHSSVFCVV
jgi:hypothetical protein